MKLRTKANNTTSNWKEIFRFRRRRHDPMLVLSIADFNFADSWARIFSPIKSHENGIYQSAARFGRQAAIQKSANAAANAG